MSKFCPLCNEVTNCTDNCKSCMEEESAYEMLEEAFDAAEDAMTIAELSELFEEETKCQRNSQNDQSEKIK